MTLPAANRYHRLLSGILLAAAALFSSGCTSVTDEELLILRKIGAVYEAEVSAKAGYKLTGDGRKSKGRYIEITIANPESATAGPAAELDYPASGCAYAISKARFQAGGAPYDFVRVNITRQGNTKSFEYPASTIERYRKQYVRIDKLLAGMRRQGFHKEYFNQSYTDSAQTYSMFKILRVLSPDSVLLIGFKEGHIDSAKVLGIGYLMKEVDRRLVFITDLDSTQAPFVGFQVMK
ncbi:hypothetical protein EJV47_21740 [Hymenobacter gummosus]|uniref:Uncharacterized protein n=1 Tax=Hymenobacter gummosus TaxID=1776032 RepID=A0A3S0IKJ4_9BACT|nr:hypothetical protein [Hymenobacter gummosus]RTQ46574.1 hypothetical protein EJV47_21740 [Hymenobacter gummosus]